MAPFGGAEDDGVHRRRGQARPRGARQADGQTPGGAPARSPGPVRRPSPAAGAADVRRHGRGGRRRRRRPRGAPRSEPEVIVLDASALVALQDRRDRCYEAALETVRDEPGPFIVPLGALPEADALLAARSTGAMSHLLASVAD